MKKLPCALSVLVAALVVALGCPSALATLQEALDTESSGLTWTTGGDGDWVPQTIETQDGLDAAQAPALSSDGESSYVETIVQGPGQVSFWWKLDGDRYEAELSVRYGTGESTQTGYYNSDYGSGWRLVTIPITETGPVPVRWTHNRYDDNEPDMERAFLDLVLYFPLAGAKPIYNSFYSPAQDDRRVGADEGYTIALFAQFLSESDVTLSWKRNGVDPTAGSTWNYDEGVYWEGGYSRGIGVGYEGTYSVIATNDFGSTEILLGTYELHNYSEALDYPIYQGYNSQTFGTAPFNVQTTDTQDGEDAISLTLTDRNGYLAGRFQGPGVVRFWRKFTEDVPGEAYAGASANASEDSVSVDFGFVPGWVQETLILAEEEEYYVYWDLSNYNGTGSATLSLDAVTFQQPDEGPLLLAKQPESAYADEGATVTLRCLAFGVDLEYVWYDGDDNQVGTGPEYVLTNIQQADAGSFYCTITSEGTDSVTSDVVTVTVGPLGKSVDYVDVPWVSYGRGVTWLPQTDFSLDGVDAAESSQVTDDVTTRLTAMVPGPSSMVLRVYLQEDSSQQVVVWANGTAMEYLYPDAGSGWQMVNLVLPDSENLVEIRQRAYDSEPGGTKVWVDDVRVVLAKTYAQFVEEHFTEAEILAGVITDSEYDADFDGIANILEHYFLLNPREPSILPVEARFEQNNHVGGMAMALYLPNYMGAPHDVSLRVLDTGIFDGWTDLAESYALPVGWNFTNTRLISSGALPEGGTWTRVYSNYLQTANIPANAKPQGLMQLEALLLLPF